MVEIIAYGFYRDHFKLCGHFNSTSAFKIRRRNLRGSNHFSNLDTYTGYVYVHTHTYIFIYI